MGSVEDLTRELAHATDEGKVITQSVAATSKQSPGAIAELRTATWPSHQRLEKRLNVKARFSNLDAYRGYLQGMWGFCATLEPQLARALCTEALPDYESRRKLSLLTRDLLALGADSTDIENLAACRDVPHCTEPAAAFGCAYVLEGATLGGRTLLPLVESHLGLTSQTGAAFLASYGVDVSSMWQRFGAALDTWCSDPARTRAAARAAVDTFGALEVWLCGAPS
jgi:heme oxygenase